MKVKVVSPSRSNADAWCAALQSVDRSLDVHAIVHSIADVNVLVNGSRPDLVVVEATTAREFTALETLANAHPEIEYVLVGTEMTSDVLLRAMRVGVREVLPAPCPPETLAAAVQRLARRHTPAPAKSRQGEILSFVSCKGGSGATFVAANLAHILAGGGRYRVALIDMNLQFGDAALFVTNERPVSNVADVARNIQRLDAQLLESAMTQAAPGLFVLAAPDDPAHAGDVTPAHVKAILQLASQIFDYVVVDLGRSLTLVTLQALDQSDRVYAVLQLTLPFIRDGKRLRDVFRSLDYPAKKIHWIVNRHQKETQITLADLKRTLGIADVVTLPNQYEVVAASVNEGVTVDRVAPGSAITKALRQLARDIAPEIEKGRAGGWLSGLFKGGGTQPKA
jgi:pilus assembly protein CpaE